MYTITITTPDEKELTLCFYDTEDIISFIEILAPDTEFKITREEKIPMTLDDLVAGVPDD